MPHEAFVRALKGKPILASSHQIKGRESIKVTFVVMQKLPI